MNIVCPHCNGVNNVPKKDSYTKANCGACKKSLLDGKVANLEALTFDEFIVNSDIPVLIDFWAPWCGPCRSFAPTFAQIAKKYPLKAAFGKMNTEEEQYYSSQYGIRSIPTLIVFKNGKEVDRVNGALNASALEQLVKKHL
jgi:thioredoxin 2